MATKPKPTSLRITKVRRTRKTIFIAYKNGDEEHDLTSRDNPLPAFTKALDALVAVVLSVCHFPEGYGENMTASGLTLTEKGMVTIQAKKSLPDAAGPLNIATPLRFLEHPKEEGSYSPSLTDEQVDAISEVEEQAKAYVKGDRAQGQIKFEEEDPDVCPPDEVAGAETKEIEFAPDDGGSGKPAKKKRSRK
ncbi:MAG: hypothetical protein JSR30_00275 [Proteobacteria bacterium]|nr:hypothetical protein [Pseudomonadota bacterium]